MNKYFSKKVTIDDITFHSKKEAQRYLHLKKQLETGGITDLKLQPKYELIPKQTGERSCVYIGDFEYKVEGVTIVEDTKGYKTKDYIIKRKLFKFKYPNIVFREV